MSDSKRRNPQAVADQRTTDLMTLAVHEAQAILGSFDTGRDDRSRFTALSTPDWCWLVLIIRGIGQQIADSWGGPPVEDSWQRLTGSGGPDE